VQLAQMRGLHRQEQQHLDHRENDRDGDRRDGVGARYAVRRDREQVCRRRAFDVVEQRERHRVLRIVVGS